MFTIPTIGLDRLTPDAVRQFLAEAREARTTEFAAARQIADTSGAASVPAETLTRLTELQAFITDAEAYLNELSQAEATAAAAVTAEQELAAANAAALAELSAAESAAAGQEKAPTVSEVSAGAPLANTDGIGDGGSRLTLIASADVPGFASGQELTFDQAAAAMVARTNAYTSVADGTPAMSHGFATIRRPGTEFVAYGDRRDFDLLDRVADERARHGGQSLVDAMSERVEQGQSLVAAAGWCAPSEIDYTIRSNGQVAAMPTFPTVQAPRGGVSYMPPIEFADVFGGTTGTSFFGLTEAQVAGGNTKTMVEVGCPTPTEARLRVDGFGAITNLLTMRAYPEYARQYIALSLVGLEHKLAGLQLAAVAAGSTPVDLTASNPFSNDGSVYAQLLNAVEMAAVDIRYRLRLSESATIEVQLPQWALAQIRADVRRRAGREEMFMADAMIMREFAALNVAPQFVYNYRDAWSGVAGAPGSASPITALPGTLKFLAYPAGTWVRAESPVIDLSTVYDATRVAANQRLEVFTESGHVMIKRGSSISREYTLTICPSGATGAAKTISC